MDDDGDKLAIIVGRQFIISVGVTERVTRVCLRQLRLIEICERKTDRQTDTLIAIPRPLTGTKVKTA